LRKVKGFILKLFGLLEADAQSGATEKACARRQLARTKKVNSKHGLVLDFEDHQQLGLLCVRDGACGKLSCSYTMDVGGSSVEVPATTTAQLYPVSQPYDATQKVSCIAAPSGSVRAITIFTFAAAPPSCTHTEGMGVPAAGGRV
jgi:hypothetical protein